MRYPSTIKSEQKVGITAPSSGVGDDIESFEKSLNQLKKAKFGLAETENVRSLESPSSSANQRAKEFMQLWTDEHVGFILSASGGDFLEEMLPYLDWDKIEEVPKWVQGYSDNTGILFPLTTKCDIATIYGPNAGAFDMTNLHSSLEVTLEYMKGNFVNQNSYEKYQQGWGDGIDGYDLNRVVEYKLPNGNINVTGRVLGGCLDILKDLKGTPYEDVKGFVQRYKEDGMVWYFDIFAMKAEDVAHTIWSMKQAGWFETTKAIIVGRVCFPSTMMDMTYEDAFLRVFGKEMPIVTGADVGHVKPIWTMVNGAMCHLQCADGKGSIRQWME